MNQPDETLQCRYTTFVRGDESFFRAVGIPLANALEGLPSSEISHKDGDLDESLAVNKHPQNVPVLIGGAVAVFLFITGRIAGKIVDDFYTAKIQPIVKRVLGQSDQKLTGAIVRKKKMYQRGVWYDQERILILIVIVGDSFGEILNHHDAIPAVHATAVTWIAVNGRHKAIHLYLLEDGRVNAMPLLFDTLIAANQHVENQQSFVKPQSNS